MGDELERFQQYHEAHYGHRMTEEELRQHIERETGGVAREPDNRPPWMKIWQVGKSTESRGSADEDEEKEVLTVAEAARLLGMTKQGPFRHVWSGRIKVQRFGPKMLRVLRSEVERFKAEREREVELQETGMLVGDVARMLGTTDETVYQLTKEGKPPATMTHVGRRKLVWDREEILEYMRGGDTDG